MLDVQIIAQYTEMTTIKADRRVGDVREYKVGSCLKALVLCIKNESVELEKGHRASFLRVNMAFSLRFYWSIATAISAVPYCTILYIACVTE